MRKDLDFILGVSGKLLEGFKGRSALLSFACPGGSDSVTF